jgi:hypothetical protein
MKTTQNKNPIIQVKLNEMYFLFLSAFLIKKEFFFHAFLTLLLKRSEEYFLSVNTSINILPV